MSYVPPSERAPAVQNKHDYCTRDGDVTLKQRLRIRGLFLFPRRKAPASVATRDANRHNSAAGKQAGAALGVTTPPRNGGLFSASINCLLWYLKVMRQHRGKRGASGVAKTCFSKLSEVISMERLPCCIHFTRSFIGDIADVMDST